MHPVPRLAPGADELLDALDPEQREVALGAARTGAGAGRRRHRQDPRDHAPDRLRRRLRGLQPHTRCSRSPSPPAPPARCAPGCAASVPAACRPARSTPPRCGRPASSGPGCTAASCPSLTESKLGLIGNAARRNRVQTDQADAARPGQRGRVGQGQQRPPRRLRPGRRGPRPRRSPAQDAATVARVFATYEDVKRDQGRMDMEDVLLCAAALLAEDERVAAQVRRQYKWFVVDEFQDVSPIQAALLDLWLGGRDDLCVVGDPAQTIYSFAGRQRVLPPRLPEEARRGPPRSSWSATTAPRRRWSTPPTGCWPARRSAGVQLRSQQDGRPRGRLRRALRRGRRGRAGRRPTIARADRRRHPGRARSRCCSGSTPSPRRSRRRSPPAACPTSCAARPGSSSGPRSSRPSPCCAATPAAAAGSRRRAWSRDVRAVLAGMGWTAEAPTGRGNVRDRWESLQAIVSQAEELPGRRARRRRWPTSSPSSTAAPPSSTPRSPRASRWPRCTPPRASSGTWSSWPACRRARCRSSTPTVPAAVEEERRLLYVGMTRARQRLTVSWSLARTPGGRSSRKPSRFLDRAAPARPPRTAPPRARPVEPQAQGRRALPRVRQAAGHDGGAQGGPLRGLPGVLRRGAVRAAARLAGGAGRPGEGAGVRRVHRPDAAGDRRGQAGRRPVPAADQRHRRRPSSTKYGDEVLAAGRRRGRRPSAEPPPTCRRPGDGPPMAHPDQRPARPVTRSGRPRTARPSGFESFRGNTQKIDCRLQGTDGSFLLTAPRPRTHGPDNAGARARRGGDRSEQHHRNVSQHADFGMPAISTRPRGLPARPPDDDGCRAGCTGHKCALDRHDRRDRGYRSVDTDVAVLTGAFPGTSAWSPPI